MSLIAFLSNYFSEYLWLIAVPKSSRRRFLYKKLFLKNFSIFSCVFISNASTILFLNMERLKDGNVELYKLFIVERRCEHIC